MSVIRDVFSLSFAVIFHLLMVKWNYYPLWNNFLPNKRVTFTFKNLFLLVFLNDRIIIYLIFGKSFFIFSMHTQIILKHKWRKASRNNLLKTKENFECSNNVETNFNYFKKFFKYFLITLFLTNSNSFFNNFKLRSFSYPHREPIFDFS